MPPRPQNTAEISAELLARWGVKDEEEWREHVRWIRRWRGVTIFCGQLARYMLWTAVAWAILAVLNSRLGWLGVP